MRKLLYIVILLVAAGCSYAGAGNDRGLDEAAEMLHKDPAGALQRLNGYDVAEFGDSATMARWALLYSEALVINRFAAPSDTIVNIAIDYYGNHNLEAEYRRASQLRRLLTSRGERDELATALYIQKEKEFDLYTERVRRERILLIGGIVLIAAIGVIVWMRQRMRLQASRNDALMAEASALRCQIDASRSNVGRLETKLHGLLDNRFTLIDSLCQTYYESQGTRTERKAIVDRVKSEIEALRTDALADMERAVNDCRDNLLTRTHSACPDMDADTWQLLVYLASGLSTRTISLLTGVSVEVVYKRKSRLKARMRERVAEACPDIMAIF